MLGIINDHCQFRNLHIEYTVMLMLLFFRIDSNILPFAVTIVSKNNASKVCMHRV